MAQTIRLLATHKGNKPGTIITVSDAEATALLAGGVNATTDLTGGLAPRVEPKPLSDSRPKSTLVARTLRSAWKWFGAAQNGNTFNETGSTYTIANYGAGIKLEAEAPFVAVRLWWVSRVPNAMTGSKALIGVTETADTSVAAQAFHPRIGGATYNTTVAPPNLLGWRAVTWNGQATVDHPAANAAAQVKVSDWMTLTSIPRTDGGTRPLLLVRAEHDGAAGGAFATYSNSAIAALRTANQAARGRIIQLFTGNNMVSTPAAVNGGLNTGTLEVFPEFRYSVPSLSVCGVGDSIMQCEGIALTGSITSWGFRGCAEVSTMDRPINWASSAASGKTFSEFWGRFQELFAAGYKPDVLVVAPTSVNDYNGDLPNMQFYMDQGKARAQQVIEFAQSNGIRSVVFFPLCPFNSLNAANDIKRREYNDWLRAFAAATGSQYMDVSGLGDGNVPERWVTAYNYSNDGIHPNEAGVENVMTPALVACLRNIE